MNQVEVKSSFIQSIGYEDGTLEVEYKDGGLYKYTDVPYETYESVMGAESIGRSLREQVFKGGFSVERVEKEML